MGLSPRPALNARHTGDVGAPEPGYPSRHGTDWEHMAVAHDHEHSHAAVDHEHEPHQNPRPNICAKPTSTTTLTRLWTEKRIRQVVARVTKAVRSCST